MNWEGGSFKNVRNTLDRLRDTVEGNSGLVTRVAALEFGGNVTTGRPGRLPPVGPNVSIGFVFNSSHMCS